MTTNFLEGTASVFSSGELLISIGFEIIEFNVNFIDVAPNVPCCGDDCNDIIEMISTAENVGHIKWSVKSPRQIHWTAKG